MYSPFLNENKEFKSINEITYTDLEQLITLEEGYQLEFKGNFNENVRKKIPAIMTSFANSSGGWIIIGIDDKSKNVTPIMKERNDFGQLISQLIKGQVTPIPQYDIRFLECPGDSNCGVLIIQVIEGKFPPYTSNGTIFIRNGSSKEPIQRADRATIELLFSKGKKFKNDIEDFFQREITFPYNNIARKTREYSICNIYIKSLLEVNIFETYQCKEDIKNKIVQSENSIFQCAQYDLNSILFKHRQIAPFSNEVTMLYELYKNTSAKIHIPLVCMNDLEKKYVAERISQPFAAQISDGAQYKVIDGVTCVTFIYGVLKKHIDILRDNNISLDDLVLQVECEDVDNAMLYFDCPSYYAYIKENGLCYCQKKRQKTKIIYLRDCMELKYEHLASAIAFDIFTYFFGFHPDKAFEIFDEACEKRYPEKIE